MLKRNALLFLALALVGACNDYSIPTASDAIAAIDRIEVDPDPVEVEENSSTLVGLVAYDAAGERIDAPLTPTWHVENGTIAQITVAGRLSGLRPGASRLTATLGEHVAEAPLTVTAIPSAAVQVSPASLTMESGETRSLSATAISEDGVALNDRSFDWSSSAPSVVRVDSSGTLIATSAGEARITARSGSATGHATVAVTWAPARELTLEPDPARVSEGRTIEMRAIAYDAAGNEIAEPAVEWETLTPTTVSVTRDGVVRGLAMGTGRIEARVDGQTAFADVTVEEAKEATIDRVAPQPLKVGETATVTGSGFAEGASNNTVSIDGVAAAIESATPTELRFIVPDLGLGSCDAAASRTLAVSATHEDGEWTASASVDVAGGGLLDLAPGEGTLLGDVQCAQIPAGEGQYLLSVYHSVTSPSAVRQAGVRGTVEAESAPSTSFVMDGTATSPLLDTEFGGAAMHSELLAENVRIAGTHAPARRLAALGDGGVAAAPELGDIITVHVPDIQAPCTPYTTVDARVVYAGERAVVLEDPDNPGAGAAGEAYRRMGEEFETRMLPILEANFGDPLAYDSQLDNNGRILMLFTKAVREMGGGQLAGFVTTADFSDPAACGASDRGEIFYALAPKASTPADIATWEQSIQSTIIHEVKHLTSYAERYSLSSVPSLEDRWLEESTAMISEEIWGRTQYGFQQYGNTRYEESLECERGHSGDPECATKPRVMTDHFGFLSMYYSDVENKTPIGQSTSSDYTFYGSGWNFVRWAADHFGDTESSFFRALTQTSATGVSNLTGRTGTSYEDLLGAFSLAMISDDLAGLEAANPLHTLPSWDTRSVFAGLYRDEPGFFTSEFPLQPRAVGTGAFEVTISALRGGTAAFLAVDAVDAIRTLTFTDGGSGPLPDGLGIAVIRVR